MKIVVTFNLSECEFDAAPKTQARQIFQMICKNFLIVENWYFGLYYKGADNEIIWIDGSKKPIKELRNVATKLNFDVKYYPEDIAEELIEKTTIELFFTNVRHAVIKDEIYCPSSTCVLLASYALQARNGDYLTEMNGGKGINAQKLLPARVFKQHELDTANWEESIMKMWQKHKSMDSEDAMLEYLKLAQNLEMYGVSFFRIRNKKGSELLLGINALGLNIYKPEDKLNPQISFPWSEIKKLKFKDRKFTIKPIDRTSTDFTFFTSDGKISKHILSLGIGNHALYIKRRKPEDPEIKKLKEKANEIRANRQKQKELLRIERSAREEVERREKEYKEMIESLQEEMRLSKNSLLEAQDTIRRLNEQLDELQRSKQELEDGQEELKAMMRRLEAMKSAENEERRKLEEEIGEKQKEVERILQEVERREDESRRLQEEIDQARIREQELLELMQKPKEVNGEVENEQDENDKELETLPDGVDTNLPELSHVNEQLMDEFIDLERKLDETRKEEETSDLDKIHRINIQQGRDKYKTLRDIRKGNTVRRIELFENM